MPLNQIKEHLEVSRCILDAVLSDTAIDVDPPEVGVAHGAVGDGQDGHALYDNPPDTGGKVRDPRQQGTTPENEKCDVP